MPSPILMKELLGGLAGAGLSLPVSAYEGELMGTPQTKKLNTMINAVTGGVIGGAAVRNSPGARKAIASALLGWPAKTTVLSGVDALKQFTNIQMPIADSNLEAAKLNAEAAQTNAHFNGKDATNLATALAALGGAGGLGYYLYKRFVNPPEEKSRLKVTLPTRKPGDVETQLDMPLNTFDLPQTIQQGLRRDTRRHLRRETSGRVEHLSDADLARMRRARPVEEEPSGLEALLGKSSTARSILFCLSNTPSAHPGIEERLLVKLAAAQPSPAGSAAPQAAPVGAGGVTAPAGPQMTMPQPAPEGPDPAEVAQQQQQAQQEVQQAKQEAEAAKQQVAQAQLAKQTAEAQLKLQKEQTKLQVAQAAPAPSQAPAPAAPAPDHTNSLLGAQLDHVQSKLRKLAANTGLPLGPSAPFLPPAPPRSDPAEARLHSMVVKKPAATAAPTTTTNKPPYDSTLIQRTGQYGVIPLDRQAGMVRSPSLLSKFPQATRSLTGMFGPSVDTTAFSDTTAQEGAALPPGFSLQNFLSSLAVDGLGMFGAQNGGLA